MLCDKAKLCLRGRGWREQGNKVLKLENACYSVGGRTILQDFCYEFMPGERIGVVGPNGAGTSSFFDVNKSKPQMIKAKDMQD